MERATIFCPNPRWPASGQTGQSSLGVHAPQSPRSPCDMCPKTWSATKGRGVYRGRPTAETGGLVVTVLASGCPVQVLGAALGLEARTGAAWWAHSGRQGQAVPAQLGEHPRDLG